MVGVSTFSGYSSNESSMLSLAVVDVEQSEPGTEVTLVWGEEGGGSAKPVVERHVQTEIRATVSPVPYAEVVRASYRPALAVSVAGDVELLGLYWTVSGPVEVHVGREWSLFDWADRCAEARKVGFSGLGHLARRPRARARDARACAEMKQVFDDNGLALPRARVPDGLVPRPGRRAAPGLRRDARAALRRGRRARRASHQGRQHPRHAGVALAADRALRRALRRRRRAHRREDRLRVHAVRRRTSRASTPCSRSSAARAPPNGGIAIDTWHMSKLGIAPDELRRIPLEYLSLDRAERRPVRGHGRPDRRGRQPPPAARARASSTSAATSRPARITATPGPGASRCSPRSCATTRST